MIRLPSAGYLRERLKYVFNKNAGIGFLRLATCDHTIEYFHYGYLFLPVHYLQVICVKNNSLFNQFKFC